MSLRVPLLLSTAALTLAGIAAAVFHSEAVPPTRPTDFATRFQPTLDAEAHIGTFKSLPPVDLDGPASRGPSPAMRHTTKEHRHEHRPAHP
ncbi:hypothetical protein [Variovorax saccharolyticus]|uniref:hypothetical protein n=1 Tax=Variovorax saccharolyticus TaxID=3053516 RepID=UPI0025758F59|nr:MULTISPECIES: hypothetical protein [unclassified Variovorax]MDM0022662.1 hypothetical protein [Variovorax sp. J22R187]MDM0029553.1 hypothetical protein [Variovorax sp. J31P216]